MSGERETATSILKELQAELSLKGVAAALRRRLPGRTIPESTVRGWIDRGNPPSARKGRLSGDDAEKASVELISMVEEHLDAVKARTLAECWGRWDGSVLAERRSGIAHRSNEAARGRDHRDRRAQLRDDVYWVLEGGRPVVAADLDLAGMFRMGSELSAGDVPSYVVRDHDVELERRLRDALRSNRYADPRVRFVAVAGQPKTGKTRSLLELVRAVSPEATVFPVGPPDRRPAPLEMLPEVLDESRLSVGGKPWVVVVDDLERYAPVANLTRAIERLTEIEDTIVVATVSAAFLLHPRDDVRSLGYSLSDQTFVAQAVVWVPERLTVDDELRAMKTFESQLASGQLSAADLSVLPARAAAMDLLLERARFALRDGSHPGRQAVMAAALDVSIPPYGGAGRWPASAEELDVIAHAHLRERHAPTHLASVRDAMVAEANVWARETVGGPYALLNPRRGGPSGKQYWELPDYVVANLLDDHSPAPYLAGHVHQARAVGFGHLEKRRERRAEAAFWFQTVVAGRGDEDGDEYAIEDAETELVVLQSSNGDLIDQLEALANRGNTTAIDRLIPLMEIFGPPEEAERWILRRYGDDDRLRRVKLAWTYRDWPERESQYLQLLEELAAEGERSILAMFATELLARGRRAEAKRWLAEGASRGDADCILYLAVVHTSRGRFQEADEAWSRLSESSIRQFCEDRVCEAMYSFEWPKAIARLEDQRAAEPSDPTLNFRLGFLYDLNLNSDLDAAIERWTVAAEAGHKQARELLELAIRRRRDVEKYMKEYLDGLDDT